MLYLAACPWLVRAEVLMNFDQGLLVHLDPQLAEVVSMATSLEGACRFCYATSRFLLRIRGYSEHRVRQLEILLTDAPNDERLSAAIDFCRRMCRADPLTQINDRTALTRAGYSAEEVHELAYVVAFTLFANRVATMAALSPFELEKMPDQLLVKLLRPLIARQISKHSSRGRPEHSHPDYSGPYAYLLDGFRNSPVAGMLATVMPPAWEAQTLGRRAKGLILGVIAHALGCEKTAADARMLALDAGIDVENYQHVLQHLNADILDEQETLLVSLARQSVWYRPVQIQQEAKHVLDVIGQTAFTEAIGVMALANALCRLGAVVAPVK